jgi:hypothetical protein
MQGHTGLQSYRAIVRLDRAVMMTLVLDNDSAPNISLKKGMRLVYV